MGVVVAGRVARTCRAAPPAVPEERRRLFGRARPEEEGVDMVLYCFHLRVAVDAWPLASEAITPAWEHRALKALHSTAASRSPAHLHG